MKIIYAQNPLKSVVELDEKDMQILKLKITISELYEDVFNSYWRENDISKIKDSLEDIINADGNEESEQYKRVEYLTNLYVKELSSGSEHSGDCTKIACSCLKCGAEDALGINTTEGLNCLHYISNAFSGDRKTLDEAIEYLMKPAVYDKEWHTPPNIERWEKERKVATESLIKYKEKHFNDN